MGEVDRIHRVVPPAHVPAPTQQVSPADDRREERPPAREDQLELHETEAEQAPEGATESIEPPPLPNLDIAV